MNRKNSAERNSKIELTYSNGESQLFHLKNTDKINDIQLESVKTNMVKITIKEVYGTINNGGAFNFYGVECNNNLNQDLYLPEKAKMGHIIKTLFESTSKDIFHVNCLESITNSNKFDYINMTNGSKIVIKCPESCANTGGPIYGTNIYSKDSALCRAAYHSNKLPSMGGKITVVFDSPISYYKSSLSNSIWSEGKSSSHLSILFEEYKIDEEIIIRPGSKVDLANPEGSGFVPGMILSVDTKNEKLKYLKIMKEDDNSGPIIISYPNKEKIRPCGEYLKERDCKGSRKTLESQRPIKIRFVPKNYNSAGNYLSDIGQLYGEDDKPYGWTKNMSSHMRLRNNPSKPELETLVEFPPSPLSKFCNKASPDTLCEQVSWIAKVGVGRFIVKIFVGDPHSTMSIDLKINDKFVAQNKIIEKNSMEVIEDIVESNKKFIVLTSECKTKCKLSITKINAIEIVKYSSSVKLHEKEETKEVKLDCGYAFKGGRCDHGPDVINCLFDDPSNKSAQFCNGDKMSLVEIPAKYKCKDQYGKFKCVYVIYFYK